MLKLTARFITQGRQEVFYGDEFRVRQWLHQHCPESQPYHDIDDAVRAVNDFGQVEVEVQPYQPPPQSNLLPENYLEHEESEDPWPRTE